MGATRLSRQHQNGDSVMYFTLTSCQRCPTMEIRVHLTMYTNKRQQFTLCKHAILSKQQDHSQLKKTENCALCVPSAEKCFATPFCLPRPPNSPSSSGGGPTGAEGSRAWL